MDPHRRNAPPRGDKNPPLHRPERALARGAHGAPYLKTTVYACSRVGCAVRTKDFHRLVRGALPCRFPVERGRDGCDRGGQGPVKGWRRARPMDPFSQRVTRGRCTTATPSPRKSPSQMVRTAHPRQNQTVTSGSRGVRPACHWRPRPRCVGGDDVHSAPGNIAVDRSHAPAWERNPGRSGVRRSRWPPTTVPLLPSRAPPAPTSTAGAGAGHARDKKGVQPTWWRGSAAPIPNGSRAGWSCSWW